MENNEIILGLDVSTSCIGYCLVLNDGSEYGKIITLGHIAPKVPKDKPKIERLILEKRIFQQEFINRFKEYKISKVVIEEPLLGSNNIHTVATLLQFNSLISEGVYDQLGIVPDYISSNDARKFSFPELLAVRKIKKDGTPYPRKKIINSIKKGEFSMFGGYPDCDKKAIVHGFVSEVFPNIPWLLNKKNELKKENFDACDAYVACLGQMNKERHGGVVDIEFVGLEEHDNMVEYTVSYWGAEHTRKIYF